MRQMHFQLFEQKPLNTKKKKKIGLGAFLTHLLSCRTLHFTKGGGGSAALLWQKENAIRQHHSSNL